jgi:hypothetical protein
MSQLNSEQARQKLREGNKRFVEMKLHETAQNRERSLQPGQWGGEFVA